MGSLVIPFSNLLHAHPFTSFLYSVQNSQPPSIPHRPYGKHSISSSPAFSSGIFLVGPVLFCFHQRSPSENTSSHKFFQVDHPYLQQHSHLRRLVRLCTRPTDRFVRPGDPSARRPAAWLSVQEEEAVHVQLGVCSDRPPRWRVLRSFPARAPFARTRVRRSIAGVLDAPGGPAHAVLLGLVHFEHLVVPPFEESVQDGVLVERQLGRLATYRSNRLVQQPRDNPRYAVDGGCSWGVSIERGEWGRRGYPDAANGDGSSACVGAWGSESVERRRAG